MPCRVQFSIRAFSDLAWKRKHTNDTGEGEKNETMCVSGASNITFQCEPDGRKNKGHNCGRCIQQLLVETFATLENGEYQLKGQRR